MKGKGKGERNDMKDCPLTFPEMNPVEHARLCPRYSAVLTRGEDGTVGVEELDSLQTELENLLAAAAKRMLQLKNEIDTLTMWQEKGKDKKIAGKVGPESPTRSPSGKRGPPGKSSDDKPSKKIKTEPSGKGTGTPASKKGKVQQLKVPPMPEFPDSPTPKPPELPKLPEKNIPNRFWAMVEPYCADITNDDLKVLEDLMKQHEDDSEYYKIPNQGKHYSQKWAQEDLLEEQREGNKASDKRRSLNSSTGSNSGDGSSSGRGDEESSPFGPLTQRLVQALIEENVMTPIDETISEADAAEAATISPRSLAKQLNIGNAAALERRIKRELEENGILEVDDNNAEDNPDDEILAELKKKQQELKALSQHNLGMIKRLHKLAKEEIQKQDLRKKMAAADVEVMDAYRKIQASRQKKKTPTKKEKDAAMKALKERDNIVKQLEGMMS